MAKRSQLMTSSTGSKPSPASSGTRWRSAPPSPPMATVEAGDTATTVPSAGGVDTYISPVPLGSAKRSCPLLVNVITTLVCFAFASLADFARRI